ncbi:MAG: YaiI/YqxD family protein [Gammaproteobacteria bacterium]
MKIWVDADACPVVVREILFRAAERTEIQVTLVANAFLRVPESPYIRFLKVPRGFDVADQRIGAELATGDLVVTADIPLAAIVIEQGGHALSPRGELFTADNIRSLLSLRDFMDTLRSSGVRTGGPPPLSASDRKAFADALDRFLTRHGTPRT